VQMLKQVSPSQYQPAHGADYPRGRFGKAMMQIAQLIKADVGLQLAFADVTGWDTHVNQGSSDGQLAARLADFGQALAAFAEVLARHLGAKDLAAIFPGFSPDAARFPGAIKV